ncbi:MAG: hypothetical protein R3Y07_01200 [Eubacteriales bacterium]
MNGNKLSHAYLISGQGGHIEKATFIAKKALCESENSPCGHCIHCKKVEKMIHPDFQVHENKDGKPLKIEQVRDIRSDAVIRPNEGKRKVYLLLRADELSEKVQNTLLKILEEPPASALFILATGESGGVIPTIRSRCQRIFLPPVEMEQHPLAAEIAAQIAQGRSELTLLETCLPIGKMKKDEITQLCASLRVELMKEIRQIPQNQRAVKGMHLLDEIERGAQFYVSASGISALICASIYKQT